MLSKAEIQTFVLQSSFSAQRQSLSKEEFKAWVIGCAQECSKMLIGETIQIEMDITRPLQKNKNFEFTKIEKMRQSLLTEQQKQRFKVYHNPGYIHLSYNTKKTGIEMLGDIVHELEHERQLRGIGYSPEQQKLCLFSDLYYIPAENATSQYQNNYLEVYARIAEMNIYLDAIATQNTILSLQDKQSLCDACNNLYRWLEQKIDFNDTQTLLTYYQRNVIESSLEELKPLLPNIDNPSERDREELLNFLTYDANHLMKQAWAACKETLHALCVATTMLQQQTALESSQHQPFEHYLQEFATVCDIPLIKQLQSQSPCLRYIPINENNFHQTLQYATKSLDTPVLTFQNQQWYLAYYDPSSVSISDNTPPPTQSQVSHDTINHSLDEIDTSLEDYDER